ncbi:hypothetical protein J1N35_043227 [Gossypium stocksii]|uniref:Uncharacterized protein n=1 Tax=Gossypium stocksii TaxID=47602 RepID=A0A9D3U733_9ROSI|nr:hypothetical protein J1N35_043227 [Gossypium stocksii]
MSERINVVIYYDGEVRDTENIIVFLSKSTTRLLFSQNIDLTELRKRIKRKIFRTTPMRVSSIKYRFYALVDPMRYDSFDIKGTRSLKVMVQTHLASGSPYLELYVQFSSPNEAFATSTSTAAQRNTRPLHDTSLGYYETSTRSDDVLPTTSTGEGTSYVIDDGGTDDESDVDPP